jgi:hypothetical protein
MRSVCRGWWRWAVLVNMLFEFLKDFVYIRLDYLYFRGILLMFRQLLLVENVKHNGEDDGDNSQVVILQVLCDNCERCIFANLGFNLPGRKILL